MNPPLCPLHGLPMIQVAIVDGRAVFECQRPACSIEISFPAPPEKP